MSLGRGYIRIYSSCTNHYSGTFRLYRAGAGDTILEIGEGANLTNDIVIANHHLGSFRVIGLIDGSTNGTFSGDITISGSNKADLDDGFQIHADPGETITVSGEIVTLSSQDEGVDITGGGTVLLTGDSAYNEPTTVRSATLGGDGTIAGTATFTNSASHSPGVDNVGVQTFNNLNYEAGSTLLWQLGTNSAASRGTDYAAIDVTGNLTLSTNVIMELSFSNAVSSVDWSNDAMWGAPAKWLIYDVAGTTTGFTNLNLAVTNWPDAQGDLFDTERAGAYFFLNQTGEDIYLNYFINSSTVIIIR